MPALASLASQLDDDDAKVDLGYVIDYAYGDGKLGLGTYAIDSKKGCPSPPAL